MNRWNRRRRGARLATAVLLLLFVACESDPVADSTVLVIKPTARPTLTSGRDREISLFGGLPRRGEASPIGRSQGSMLQHTFTREGADFDCQPDWSGGRFLFASTRHSETPDIYMKSMSGTAVTQLTSDPSSDVHPALSPDSTRVAFASNRAGQWDIWIMGLDGRRPVQVTNSPRDEVHPSWSPDGSRLVYCARPPNSGPWELWVVASERNATPTFIGYGVFPEWSPVDDRILYQRARQRGSRWFSVWTLALVDGEPRYPTEIAASADYAMILPAWSRDGESIAFTTVKSLPPIDPEFGTVYESSDIWVMDTNGGSRVRLSDGVSVNYGPAWSPDGRVLFTSDRSGHENIWSVMPTGHGSSTSPMARGRRENVNPGGATKVRSVAGRP